VAKIGDIFSGGFKIGEIWEDNSSGCLGIIGVLILSILAFNWLVDNPGALFGITLLIGGSIVSGNLLKVLAGIAFDKHYEPSLTAVQAIFFLAGGLLFAWLGFLMMLSTPMATFFVICVGIVAAMMFLGSILPD